MRRLALALFLLWPSLASAAVVNVEFKFTPFTGDPAKDDHVNVVAGAAHVFLNDVPLADQEVRKDSVPVLFDDHEVAPAVWVPVRSAGPGVRKGRNTLRIEFEPSNAAAPYRAQLRWASVMDAVKEEGGPGHSTSINQGDEGVEDKQATGKVVFGREFIADFATDIPWHHFPAVTAVSDEDRKRLAALLAERAAWFKPDFTAFYKGLAAKDGIDVAAVRKMKCADAAYKAGVRVAAPAADQLELVTTGHPEVVVKRTGGDLFPFDPKILERIKGDDTQMCVGVTLAALYPPRLVVVRMSNGDWEAVY